MNNPLLDWPGDVPPWDRIGPEDLEPALDAVLADNRALVARLDDPHAASWAAVVEPLELADVRLHRAFAPGSHLHGVLSTPQWRAAYEACLPKLTAYASEMGQNAALNAAFRHIADSESLNPAQRKLVDNALRDFRLAGVNLPDAEQARYRDIQQRLAELCNRFEQNLLDATDAWSWRTDDAAALAGLPAAALAAAAQRARAHDESGWRFGLDFPSYDAIITYADDRALRETIYTAYATRASDQGPHAGRWDNSPLIDEILDLRAELAQLLEHANYADYALESRMAESTAEIETLLLDLARHARPRAEQELAELTDFATARGGPTPLAPWDIAYYAEQLKTERYALSDELLKPYFALPAVLDGLFGVAGRLFGIRVEMDAKLPVWHPDVRAFRVFDEGGEEIALFFLDPYAREKKRGGAWMDDCAGRNRLGGADQRPVAILCCNFTPPTGDAPALLSHDELTTLFHEFGHGLHHMLTRVDIPGVAGINGVAWDAVELPSQFMENWCWERESLDAFARHFETGEPIPAAWLDKIRATRVFNSGLATLRQIELALFDLRLHRDHDPAAGARVLETLDAVRDEVSVLKPPSWHRLPNSFGHIFAGGYAAGYYSYKWAEILAADAYAAFTETAIFDADTGRRFRDAVLARGGSADAMELFIEFRGRKPDIGPLLRQEGLIDSEAA